MKIMVTFDTTEDYILEANSVQEALDLVNKIYTFKQEAQEDLLKQYNIELHVDIVKTYMEEE
jgi:hypothetical protein